MFFKLVFFLRSNILLPIFLKRSLNFQVGASKGSKISQHKDPRHMKKKSIEENKIKKLGFLSSFCLVFLVFLFFTIYSFIWDNLRSKK